MSSAHARLARSLLCLLACAACSNSKNPPPSAAPGPSVGGGVWSGSGGASEPGAGGGGSAALATGGASVTTTGGTLVQQATGGTPSTSTGVPPNCKALHGTLTTVAAGEYCVDGDVVIPQGTTLDIPAGTSFIFTGRYHFGRDPSFPDDEAHPSGSIRAIGTASAPIVFRGASESTAWYGIVIYHSDQKVQLEYVTIRDTYKDDPNVNSRIWTRGGALSSYVNNPGTIIRHSTFINNRSISISGAIDINSHGMWPNEGPIEITNSVFENNIAECTVFGGGATDPCGGGAVFFAHVGGDASVIKIENNVFRGNTAKKTAQDDACGGALAGFVDVSIVLGPGNVFENNSASTSGGAICCSGDTKLGAVFTAIDSSVRFTGNTPNNGCGR